MNQATHTAHLRLAVEVSLNGMSAAAFNQSLRARATLSTDNGLLTGDTPAELEQYSMDVVSPNPEAAELDQEQVADYIIGQVQDGRWQIEGLVQKLVRLVFAHPVDALNELAEEMLENGAIEPATAPEENCEEKIEAEVHPDDWWATAQFNAAPWFKQATDAAIMALAEQEWGANEIADAVVEYAPCQNAEVHKIMDHLSHVSRHNSIGYECRVDDESAMAWLLKHRQGVWAQIKCKEHGIRVVQSQDEATKGMWDWIDESNRNASDTAFDTAAEAAIDAIRSLELD